ncbi:MAG: hypothetical protein R3F30_10700 [Planctomycetota bacterium]
MSTKPSRRGRRFGAGDLAVLLALLGLALVFVEPGLSGRRLAAKELGSLRRFLALREAIVGAGLPTRFAELGTGLSTRPGLRPVTEQAELQVHAQGEKGPGLQLHFKDRYYGYALRVQGLRGRGPVVVAGPLEPGKTGLLRLDLDRDGQVVETPIEADRTIPLTTEDRELLASNAREARDTAELLRAQVLGLAPACEALDGALPAGLRRVPETARRAADYEDEHFLFRVDLSWVDGVLGLEVLSWPRERGVDGFAAFYGPCPGEAMQTWNLVTPYGGTEEFPRPGEARSRHGGKDDRGDWVGYDGNKWFPLSLPETPRR